MKNRMRTLAAGCLLAAALTPAPAASSYTIFYTVRCYFADGNNWWGSSRDFNTMMSMAQRCKDQGAIGMNVTYAVR